MRVSSGHTTRTIIDSDGVDFGQKWFDMNRFIHRKEYITTSRTIADLEWRINVNLWGECRGKNKDNSVFKVVKIFSNKKKTGIDILFLR